MVNLTINSIPVTVPEAPPFWMPPPSVDIEIPSLCYLKELERNLRLPRLLLCRGRGARGKLVPSCNNVVREGMVIRNSPRALEARRVNMELILRSTTTSARPVSARAPASCRRLANDMGILGDPHRPCTRQKADWTTTFPLYRDVNKGASSACAAFRYATKVQSLSVWDISGSGARTTIDVLGKPRDQAGGLLAVRSVHHALSDRRFLRERDDTQKAYAALGDPDRVTIVQIAPAVRAAWGEAFGMPTGKATVGQLVSVLRKLGADYVFDTTFFRRSDHHGGGHRAAPAPAGGRSGQPADVYLVLPGLGALLKSQFPEMTGRLSTAKSPQQMFGAVGKTWLVHNLGVDADKNLQHLHHAVHHKRPSASCRAWIRPVTAAMSIWSSPPESWRAWRVPSTSMWKTSRNPRLILRWATAPAQALFSARPAALWGAALRSAYFTTTGENPSPDAFREVRDDGTISPLPWREATFELAGRTVRCAVASGLGNARQLLHSLQRREVHYGVWWRSWHARAAVQAAAVSRWTAPTMKRPPTAARFCSDSIRMRRCVFA